MSEEKQIEEGIEIIEQEVEQKEELDLSELDSDELNLVKKHGLVKDDEDIEKPDEEVVEEPKEDDEDEINLDPDNFEEMDKVLEKNEKKFHEKFTPNQKALYFKQKAFKKKFQERDAYAKELEAKLNEISDTGDSKSKLDEIAKLLSEKKENTTLEELQEIISKKAEQTKKDDEPISQQKLQEKQATKVEFVRNIGKSKYDNFEELAKLADEVVQADTSGTYLAKLGADFESDSVDESSIVDSIIKLAKLNDKYNDVINSGKPEKKEDKINRAEKNSKKKISSASVNSAAGRNIINFNDLTLEQLANLPTEQYKKVPQSVRERLLREAS